MFWQIALSRINISTHAIFGFKSSEVGNNWEEG
jgi:hypothetical protein